MDGMLSQDEINALLNGMDIGGDAPAAADEPKRSGVELSDIEKDGNVGDNLIFAGKP